MVKVMKFFSVTFVIFLLLHGSNSNPAALLFNGILELAGHISTAGSILDITKSLIGLINTEQDTKEDLIISQLVNLKDDIEYSFNQTAVMLEKQASLIHSELKQASLYDKLQHIDRIFRNDALKLESFLRKEYEAKSEYADLKSKTSSGGDDLSEIYLMLIEVRGLFYRESFVEGLMKHQDRCISGMSRLQMLDYLLRVFRIACVKYHIARQLSIEYYKSVFPEEDFTHTQRAAIHDIHVKYNDTVRIYKELMKQSSQELVSCDHRREMRANTYKQIRAFSKYYVNEWNYVKGSADSCTLKCPNLQEANHNCIMESRVCQYVRGCPGKLIGCKSLTGGALNKSIWNLCVPGNKTALNRYTSLTIKESKNEICDGSREGLQTHVSFANINHAGFGVCEWCDCICEENVYYISNMHFKSDKRDNKIVTGARLAVENNTIFFHIQQGELMANGTVRNVTWLDKSKEAMKSRTEISWNYLKRIDLSEIKFNKTDVLVGLSFAIEGNRIVLQAITENYNFATGKLRKGITYDLVRPEKLGENEYKLDDAVVPTLSKEVMTQHSKDNQYVDFQLTSVRKDAGQNVIPFIDTQEVTSLPPVPLSGAALYIRNQEGYGGFLALKLFTYNIEEAVNTELNLPKDIPEISKYIIKK